MRSLTPLLFVSAAFAQEVALTRVASGLMAPIDIQNAHDGSGRLFFAQQNGIVRVWRNGSLAAAPFLDLRSKTRMSGECGLLGLAFPPDFARKRYFYVNYTNPGCTESTVARYRLSGDDAADAGSEQVILTVAQPFQNHNGGCLQFGPDGFLYAAFGDGGSGGDPQNQAQNRQSRLGKILRIDVESGGDGFRVPESNPFVGDRQYLPEIWALGLRNPWRFSFDRETGDMWIGDVGQSRAEEIDFQPAGRGGLNYGWRIYEGLRCFTGDCTTPGLTPPVHEYTRERGDISVTGGHVARGPGAGSVRGDYLYADYASGRIWALRRAGDRFENRLLIDSSFNVTSFGEDEAGDLYLTDHSGGGIYRVEGASRPSLSSQAVVNAASGEAGIVPGGLASLFGSNLTSGPGLTAAPSLPLPLTLAGLRVSIGGRDAPILAVANANGQEQINVQTPWETTGANAAVIVTRGGAASDSVTVPVRAAQPGVFAAAGNAIVVRASDNTLVTADRPLRRGDAAYFYATGLGAVDNTPATGAAAAASPLSNVRASVNVTLGGAPVTVLFAGLAPGFAGVYQINFTVDAGVAPGSLDLVVSTSGASSRPVKVAVQ